MENPHGIAVVGIFAEVPSRFELLWTVLQTAD